MKKEQFLHEHQRFSIRKYSFGAASVLLGASLVFAGQALADEQGNLVSGQGGTKLAVTAEAGQASSEMAELATVSQAPELSTASSQAVSETLSQATSEQAQESQEITVSTSPSTVSVASEVSPVTSSEVTSVASSEAPSEAVANSEGTVTVRAAVEATRPSGESRFFNVGESSPRQAVSELPSSGTYVYKKRTELKNEPKVSAPTQFYVNAGDSVNYDQVVTADGYQWISYKSYSGVRRYAPVLPAVSGSGKPKEDKADTKPVSDGGLDIPDKGTFVFQRNTDIKTEPKAATKPTFVFSKGDHVIYDKVLKEDGHQWISYLGFDYKRYYADVATLTEATPAKPETPVAPKAEQTSTGAENLPASGTYTVTRTLNVKNEPKAAAPTEFTLEKGYKVNYDKVLTADNHQWISYISFSGQRRYVDLATLKAVESKPVDTKPTGKIAIANMTSDGFDVVISEVSAGAKTIQEVVVPVWSDINGGDDLKWLSAQKQADGTYKTHVAVADHQGDHGDYLVHLYYKIDDKLEGVGGTTATVPEAKATVLPKDEAKPSNDDKPTPKPEIKPVVSDDTEDEESGILDIPEKGVYHFKETAQVKYQPKASAKTQYTFENGDSLNYDQVLVADGYQWISFTSFRGKRRYVAISQVTGNKDETPAKPGTDTEIKPVVKPTTESSEAPVEPATSQSQAAQKPQEDKLSGKITIEKLTATGFDVVISDISAAGKTIQEVVVPVWSENKGQDDLKWYSATKQADGSYKTHVATRDHMGDSGEYMVHLYYKIDGKLQGAGGTSTVVPQAPKQELTGGEKLPASGTYHVTRSLNVKNTPKVSAPTEFTLENGYTINYDKVLTEDDHQWLSYISYNGTRRYVDLATLKPVDNKAQEEKLAGKITIEKLTATGFDVVISDISAAGKTIQEVVVPVWSENKGQDDLKWYSATKQADGSYKTHVATRDHMGDSGEYMVHLYYKIDGKLQGAGGTSTVVPEGDKKAHELTHNGNYYSVRGKYDDIVIVNKKHGLSADYNPGENPTAKAAFTRLRDDMINQGLNVGRSYSGFRTYAYQKTLYDNYVARDGQAAADRYSARPGFSEHQTGLVFDLTDKSGNLLEDARASQWLKDNAHNYGFIVRYQAGKEASTGYMPEAWHIRYVGKEAKDIHDSGLSLEEYFGVEGGDYAKNSQPAQPAKPELPSSGTYTFTGRSSIKAEPKLSSPELAYYDKGMSVNYDKVVTAEGHTWLSYISTSGNRRYVDIAKNTEEVVKQAQSNSSAQPNIPASGRYNFTKRASIKAEAKTASPELAYFDAGMSVNYDKVLTADGHTWISYMTFSGNRRYVPVD